MTTTPQWYTDAKTARRERRLRKREVESFLHDALFEERKDLFEHRGETGQPDERMYFCWDGPIGWRVELELRADGTMPMRVSNEADKCGAGIVPVEDRVPYVRDTRDGDVYWLGDNLP